MCYHTRQSKSVQELENRFKASFKHANSYQPSIYNGFIHPETPVIANDEPEQIQLYSWGLIPHWARDKSIRKRTLNARMETIHEKPSYRGVVKNRCLILADAFYEWQWLDEKGKTKQKYELTLPGNALFGLAGLWSKWVDKSTGEPVHSYTVLTTEANELMARVHNNKKRMPVIVSADIEEDWLQGNELKMQNDGLIATPL